MCRISDEELHKKAQLSRFLKLNITHVPFLVLLLHIIFLFLSFLSSLSISFYVSSFIVSFPCPSPLLPFYYNRPIFHVFFLSSSYRPVSPSAHDYYSFIFLSFFHHSSFLPPSSCHSRNQYLSFIFFLLLFPFSSKIIFFSHPSREVSILFFSFILQVCPYRPVLFSSSCHGPHNLSFSC